MELKQIKELMAAMERAGIRKLSMKETTGFELTLEREEAAAAHPPHTPVHHHPVPVYTPHPHFPTHHASFPQRELQPEENKASVALEKKEEGKLVVSPMVGTFYASPSPDDPPFVKVGDRVEENTVVCIIEAMKVMNEVKAGVSGTLAEIFIHNGHPVEFGSKLFRIT